jgi:hypothetical protein
MRWKQIQRHALPPKPKHRGWGSPIAQALASDNSRIKPPVTLPHVAFLDCPKNGSSRQGVFRGI